MVAQNQIVVLELWSTATICMRTILATFNVLENSDTRAESIR